MILSEKVSEKLDTDLIEEIRMRTPSTESGGEFKGKGKFGKKDKGKRWNSQLDQGAQVTKWKPRNWKGNNRTKKGQQKGLARKARVKRKRKNGGRPPRNDNLLLPRQNSTTNWLLRRRITFV